MVVTQVVVNPLLTLKSAIVPKPLDCSADGAVVQKMTLLMDETEGRYPSSVNNEIMFDRADSHRLKLGLRSRPESHGLSNVTRNSQVHQFID